MPTKEEVEEYWRLEFLIGVDREYDSSLFDLKEKNLNNSET